jgi:hypothetical protein
VEALTEFIKHATLLTLLHFLLVVVFLLIGVTIAIGARNRKAMKWLLAISFVPAFSGILTTYFQNRILDSGQGMFGRLSPHAIALGRRDALISGGFGVAGTAFLLLIRALSIRMKRR